MPVEIREMVVKAIVPAHPAQAADKEHGSGFMPGPDDHDRLVEECVAAVMKILEKRDRR